MHLRPDMSEALPLVNDLFIPPSSAQVKRSHTTAFTTQMIGFEKRDNALDVLLIFFFFFFIQNPKQ